MERKHQIIRNSKTQKDSKKATDQSCNNYSAKSDKVIDDRKYISNLLLKETVSLSNEEYIIANSQILIDPSVVNYEDIYHNWKDIMQINFFSNDDLSCPICMESPIIPRTDICGHVYCLPCLIKFLSFTSDFSDKCVICSNKIDIQRVKRAGMIHKIVYKSGDYLEMSLVKRNKNTQFPTPINTILNSIPIVNTIESRFSNVALCSDDYLLSVIQMEIMILEDEFRIAIEYGNDRITAISDALAKINEDFNIAKRIPSKEIFNEAEPFFVDCNILKQIIADQNVFYQSEEGYNIFMCSVNWRCLSYEFINSGLCLPEKISARIVDLENFVVNNELHNRYGFLRHLPIGSSVSIVELDLSDIVSESTLVKFQTELRRKTDSRLVKQKIDEIDTLNKIRQEDSFHNGSKFIHVPSSMNSLNVVDNISDSDTNTHLFSHKLQQNRGTLVNRVLNMSINELSNEQTRSPGLSISDCIVTKSKKKNKNTIRR